MTVGGTPLSAQESGSKAPLRYRRLSDLFEETEEMQNFEYSGLCLLAADEPANVEQALEEKCWRDAMSAELKSIANNDTWVHFQICLKIRSP